jgi:Flp pilus assembly protein TadD
MPHSEPTSTAGQASPISQSQADLAAMLNEEAKNLMYSNHFDEAAKKFREAFTRVPDAKYALNLGLALFQLGRFNDARVALRTAQASSPTEAQAAKFTKTIEMIAKTERP